MITARIYQKRRGSIHLVLLGHAGAELRGRDPVCAGVSALAYTAAQAVRLLEKQGMLRCRPRIVLEEGFAAVIATPKKEYYAETLLTFWVIQTGLRLLAANFPGNVKVEAVMAPLTVAASTP